MNRYIFSIYDSVAETYAEPFFILSDDEEKACKIAMRSIASQDLSRTPVPISDMSLYLLGAVDPFGFLVGEEPVLLIHVEELFKGENKDG